MEVPHASQALQIAQLQWTLRCCTAKERHFKELSCYLVTKLNEVKDGVGLTLVNMNEQIESGMYLVATKDFTEGSTLHPSTRSLACSCCTLGLHVSRRIHIS